MDRATSQLILARLLELDFVGLARLVDQYLARPSRFFDGLIWLQPKSHRSLARSAKMTPSSNSIIVGFLLKSKRYFELTFLKLFLKNPKNLHCFKTFIKTPKKCWNFKHSYHFIFLNAVPFIVSFWLSKGRSFLNMPFCNI